MKRYIALVICLWLGILFIFPEKEYKQSETKPISNERSCAIEALYFEGRGTSVKEQSAILDVIMNRVNHKDYPSTICGVVQQPKQLSYRNNFKSNANLIPEFQSMNSIDRKAYLEIEKIVDNRLFTGKIKPNSALPKNALFYHAKHINTNCKCIQNVLYFIGVIS